MADPASISAAVVAWEEMAAAAALAAADTAAVGTGATAAMAAAPAALATTGAASMSPIAGGLASQLLPAAAGSIPSVAAGTAVPTLSEIGGLAAMGPAGPMTAWDSAMAGVRGVGDSISAGYDKLPKVGQKMVDGMATSTLMPQQGAPRAGGGSARMPGSGAGQGQPTPTFDYGAPNQQLTAAASKLNISEEDLKRMLTSLRGF